MPGVMPRTGRRVAGAGEQDPTGAVDAAAAQDWWSHRSGEPYAAKVACAVREEGVGNVPNSDESGSPGGVAPS
jgi:hypothetical protein